MSSTHLCATSAKVVPDAGGGGTSRLDYLDATRAFALVLGVVFHASLSFLPVFMGWAVQDVSTSPLVTLFTTISHTFRMPTFFLLAGYFSRQSLHRRGLGEFVRSRALRIGVPFVAGWFLLRPLLVSGWILGAMSLRGDPDVVAGLVGGFRSLGNLPAGLFTGSHLWFLYYLAMITALVLVVRWGAGVSGLWGEAMARRVDAWVAWLAESPVGPGLLALPTLVALGFMSSWGVDTPDRSLVPHLPVVVIEGSHFVLGWMLNRQPERMARLTRLTVARWLVAGVGIVVVLTLGDIERNPGHAWHAPARWVHAVGYALTLWLLVLLTLGVFRTLCPRPGAWVRYIADSSYWMYLIHLPIVVWLQVAVAEVPLPWFFKLGIITAVTLGVCWVSYDLCVRATWVGWLLNGRRRARVLAPGLGG